MNRLTYALGVLFMITTQQVSSMSLGCSERECIPVYDCPVLISRLRNSKRENLKILQAATCFIQGTIPMVCCQNRPTPPPTTSKTTLLPSKPGTCGMGTTGGLQRIYGGVEAPVNGYPWIVALGYKETGFNETKFLCAGSIINERYILTAAHCLTPSVLSLHTLEVVRVGDWDLSKSRDCQSSESGLELCAPPAKNFFYQEIILHSNYNKRALHSDDIALIRLSEKIDLSGNWVNPICLPPQGLSARRVVGDREAVVAGWGTTESGQGSNRLMHVLLPLKENSLCNTTYRGKMVNEQLCFGGNTGQDSCAGDSGGPLVMGGPGDQPPFLQVGIVSYGPASCGQRSVPGVYTSVSQYRDWIESNLRP